MNKVTKLKRSHIKTFDGHECGENTMIKRRKENGNVL